MIMSVYEMVAHQTGRANIATKINHQLALYQKKMNSTSILKVIPIEVAVALV